MERSADGWWVCPRSPWDGHCRRHRTEQEPIDPFAALPLDVLLAILSFLDVKQLCSVSLVSRAASCAAHSNPLWRRLFDIHFGRPSSEERSEHALLGWRAAFLRETSHVYVEVNEGDRFVIDEVRKTQRMDDAGDEVCPPHAEGFYILIPRTNRMKQVLWKVCTALGRAPHRSRACLVVRDSKSDRPWDAPADCASSCQERCCSLVLLHDPSTWDQTLDVLVKPHVRAVRVILLAAIDDPQLLRPSSPVRHCITNLPVPPISKPKYRFAHDFWPPNRKDRKAVLM